MCIRDSDSTTLSELESAFRFNDAVLRNMIVKRSEPVTGNSKIYEEELKEQEKDRERDRRREEDLAARAAAAVPATEGDAAETEPTPMLEDVVADDSAPEETN